MKRYDYIFDPAITKHPVEIVLSGHMPPPTEFGDFPDFLKIDGRPGRNYTEKQLERIGMISDDIKNHTEWNGKGTPPVADV